MERWTSYKCSYWGQWIRNSKWKGNRKVLDSRLVMGDPEDTIWKQFSIFFISDVFIDQAKALRSPTFLVKPATIRVYPDHTIRLKMLVEFYLYYLFIKWVWNITNICKYCSIAALWKLRNISTNVFHYIPIFVHFVLRVYSNKARTSTFSHEYLFFTSLDTTKLRKTNAIWIQ